MAACHASTGNWLATSTERRCDAMLYDLKKLLAVLYRSRVKQKVVQHRQRHPGHLSSAWRSGHRLRRRLSPRSWAVPGRSRLLPTPVGPVTTRL